MQLMKGTQKANIGQGYISDLESGRRKGTTAALKRIADALQVPLTSSHKEWRRGRVAT